MAAMGLPKIAAMPAVAPAANRIFLSLSLIFINCPRVEPNAPPVAIIGPSAPNGPPVPIEIADEIGFKKTMEGFILLCLVKICSIASGIP